MSFDNGTWNLISWKNVWWPLLYCYGVNFLHRLHFVSGSEKIFEYLLKYIPLSWQCRVLFVCGTHYWQFFFVLCSDLFPWCKRITHTVTHLSTHVSGTQRNYPKSHGDICTHSYSGEEEMIRRGKCQNQSANPGWEHKPPRSVRLTRMREWVCVWEGKREWEK